MWLWQWFLYSRNGSKFLRQCSPMRQLPERNEMRHPAGTSRGLARRGEIPHIWYIFERCGLSTSRSLLRKRDTWKCTLSIRAWRFVDSVKSMHAVRHSMHNLILRVLSSSTCKGPLCMICSENYVWSDAECVPCDGGPSIFLYVVMAFSGLLLLFICGYVLHRKTAGVLIGNDSSWESFVGNATTKCMSLSRWSILMAWLVSLIVFFFYLLHPDKILVKFFQIIGSNHSKFV